MTTPGPNYERDRARRRVLNATQRLRYGSAVMTTSLSIWPSDDETQWLNAVAEWLEEFGVVLAAGCDQSNAIAREYDRLRADVAAVRRVLGGGAVSP